MTKISLPTWVYETLKKYGNVALPQACNKMDTEKLVNHLQRKTGFKLKIRKTEIKFRNKYKTIHCQEIKPFLIAEVK